MTTATATRSHHIDEDIPLVRFHRQRPGSGVPLVRRLREAADLAQGKTVRNLLDEAADEIERLQQLPLL